MDSTRPIADLFDALADTYDAVGVSFFRPIADGMVTVVRPEPGNRALDIGCGRGAALVPLARAVGQTGSAIGIDISPRMVELAEQAVRDAGVVARVELGDAMEPSFPDGSFEIVVASLVLFFLPDPSSAVRRWRSLLVEGGRMCSATFGPYDECWRVRVDEVLQRYAAPEARDARTTGSRGTFGSDHGMEELLREAGYADVGTVTGSVSPRFDDAEHWHRWSMSVGQRQFWASIPPASLDDVKAEVFAAVESCRDDHGRIGFDQQIRYTFGTRRSPR